VRLLRFGETGESQLGNMEILQLEETDGYWEAQQTTREYTDVLQPSSFAPMRTDERRILLDVTCQLPTALTTLYRACEGLVGTVWRY
jgi:hypothetical protein